MIQGNLYAPTGPSVYQASDNAYFPVSSNLMLNGKYYERSKVRYPFAVAGGEDGN